MQMQTTKVKKMVLLAMLAALAFTIVAVVRIPVILWLSYEPKDVIITIGGFLFGPMASLTVSVVVSFIEMVSLGGETGPIGLLMNVLSTCSFACTAAFIYKKKRTMGGAITGLITGSVLMVVTMILWNWLITPLYMGVPRQEVQNMLIPIFLPFNAVKAGLNTALTMFLYKPIVNTLRKVRFLETREEVHPSGSRTGIYILCAALLITCIVLVLVLNGTL